MLALLVGLIALVVLLTLGWQQLVVPRFSRAVTAATGYPTEVAGLRLGWSGIVARDVVLYGLPPFSQAPLARIARLEIDLAGGVWRPRPIAVRAHGAHITYLAIGLGSDAVDNLRARGRDGAAQARGAPRSPLSLTLPDARLEAHIRLSGREGLALRSDRAKLERDASGSVRANLKGVVVELTGRATVRVPGLDLSWAPGGEARLAGDGAVISVPAGGPLLTVAAFTAERGGGGATRIRVAPRPGHAGGTLQAALTIEGQRLMGEAQAMALPLPVLQPLVSRWGVTLSKGQASATLRLAEGANTQAEAEGGAGTVKATLKLDLQAVELHHARLDRRAWSDVDLTLSAQATTTSDLSRGRIERGDVKLLGLAASLSGDWQRAPRFRGTFTITPPERERNDCAAALAASPEAVRQRLAGLALFGDVAAHARVSLDASRWDELGLAFELRPACRVRSEPTVISALLASRLGEPPSSAAISNRDLPIGLPDFVAKAALPAHLTAAFVTAEDASFRRHDGFDLEMIRRAIAHDFEMGVASKGASTITQQVAKNLFLSPDRTVGRKLAEVILTWRLEETLSKDRILELYLNIVELGPGVRGIGAAARAYFGKNASALTPLESAHLAAMLPNPIGFARRFRDGRVDEGWLRKLHDVLARMQRAGTISRAALGAARQQPLTLRRL